MQAPAISAATNERLSPPGGLDVAVNRSQPDWSRNREVYGIPALKMRRDEKSSVWVTHPTGRSAVYD